MDLLVYIGRNDKAVVLMGLPQVGALLQFFRDVQLETSVILGTCLYRHILLN